MTTRNVKGWMAMLCSVAITATAASAQTKIAVGAPPITEARSLFVAKDIGAFDKAGLAVEITTGAAGVLVPAVIAGTLNFAAIPTTSFLLGRDNGLDLVVIANCGVTTKRASKNIGLAIREGVEANAPSDLRGKKVGVPSIGGVLDVLFRQWLKDRGVDPKTVTFIEVPIPSTGDALKTGNIDGVLAGEPSLSRAASQAKGKVVMPFMAELPENLPFVTFVATGAYAKANPETVKKFRAAMTEASAFTNAPDNVAKTQEHIAAFTKMPIEIVRGMEFTQCNATPSVDQYAFFDKSMRADGQIRNPIDLASLIAP